MLRRKRRKRRRRNLMMRKDVGIDGSVVCDSWC
jgi:hypothetical protein